MLYLPTTVLSWMDKVAAVSLEMGRRSQGLHGRHPAIGLTRAGSWGRGGNRDGEELNTGESDFEEYTDDLN
jgi:hypothetical protein